MKAFVDRTGCIGCGMCANICPEVFRIAEDGLSEVYSQPDPSTIDTANQAAEDCPVSVIEIEM